MDSNTLSAWAAWAAVACGILAIWRQNRAARQLTCLQLFVQLAAQYDSADMQQVRASLAAKLLSDPDTLEINDSLLVFYENIGVLSRRGLLDPELMANTFSIDVRSYWSALRHYVEHIRNTFKEPLLFFQFERLNDHFVEEAKTYVGASTSQVGLTRDAVQSFLRCEVLRGGERGAVKTSVINS